MVAGTSGAGAAVVGEAVVGEAVVTGAVADASVVASTGAAVVSSMLLSTCPSPPGTVGTVTSASPSAHWSESTGYNSSTGSANAHCHTLRSASST